MHTDTGGAKPPSSPAFSPRTASSVSFRCSPSCMLWVELSCLFRAEEIERAIGDFRRKEAEGQGQARGGRGGGGLCKGSERFESAIQGGGGGYFD